MAVDKRMAAKAMIKISLTLTVLGYALLLTGSDSLVVASRASGPSVSSSRANANEAASAEQVPGVELDTPKASSGSQSGALSSLVRARRWAHSPLATESDTPLAAVLAQQQQQQQQQLARRDFDQETSQSKVLNLLEDEQLLRRQLPELIAQAYNDKQMERALLRMLINASTKSALSQMAQAPSTSGTIGSNANAMAPRALQQQRGLGSLAPSAAAAALYYGANDAAKGVATMDLGADNGARFLDPARLASMEQSLGSDYASVDGNALGGAGVLGGQSAGDALSQVFEKREHVKPCLFNAISCPKYPFSKVVVNKGYR